MITFFNISGCMYYVRMNGRNTGLKTYSSKIDMCRKHYTAVGWAKNMSISSFASAVRQIAQFCR